MFYTHYTHYTSYTDYTHYTHVTCVNVYTCVKCVTCVVLLRVHKYTQLEAMRGKLSGIGRRGAFMLSKRPPRAVLFRMVIYITSNYLGEKWQKSRAI